MPDGAFSAMVFVDLTQYAGKYLARSRLESLYAALLDKSQLLGGLQGQTQMPGVIAHDASTYSDPNPIDALSIKIGEAAFALDPLSSSGVQKALQTALVGSVVVNTSLAGGSTESAMSFFCDAQRSAVGQHKRWSQMFYRETDVFGGRDSAGITAEHEDRPKHLAEGAWVRLAKSTQLIKVPCLVGDKVEVRQALMHPRLSRPVAYLGGIYLQPFLDQLGNWHSLKDLRYSWRNSAEETQNDVLIRWLGRIGLLDTREKPWLDLPDTLTCGQPPEPPSIQASRGL